MSDAALVASDVERSPGDPAAVGAVVAALHGLAGGLYGRLATTPGNLALSPYSVAVALAMTRNGAAGATADEMDGVLGSTDLVAYNGGLNALTQAVEGLAGCSPGAGTIRRSSPSTAPTPCSATGRPRGGRRSWTPWPASYGAGMQVVDWAQDPQGGRAAVNAWTASRTHDRIPEILPEDAVDALTRLVLVNALYFKAPWATQLQQSATSDRPFHRSATDTVDVPTMRGAMERAAYAAADGWQAARLPYFGGTLAMTVVLPDEGGLAGVEQTIADGGLGRLLAAPKPTSVLLALPRWTFRSTSALKPVLSGLGMPGAFEDGVADFSAMTDDGTDLHVDDVAHQAFIAVDEHGTEAAAATAVGMQATSMPQYTDVTVDRPFLFVVHDVEHLTPLFLGRVADPSAS